MLPTVAAENLIRPLAGLLPLLFETALCVFFVGRCYSWSGPLSLGGAVIMAGAGTVAWVLVGTLGLSLFGALTRGFVIGWWALGLALAWRWAAPGWRHCREAGHGLRARARRLARDEPLALAVLVGVLVCAWLMAALSPPNNADSFKYHLPRQLFWIAQHSVFLSRAPFEHMLRQPPLAEYLGVHLMLLSGGDRLNNLVQFGALLHVLLLLAVILRANGRGPGDRLYAGIFLATFPAGFYEASNTKNDWVLTAFLLAILWVLSGLPKAGVLRRDAAVAVGFFAGCALLTKGTAVAYLAVMAMFALFSVINGRIRVSVCAAALALSIAVAIPATHYLRQGTAILQAESGAESQHLNARFDPLSALSVLVRNLAVEFVTPSVVLNQRLADSVVALHAGIRREVNDPGNTFAGQAFAVPYVPHEEDRPPAAVHFLLLLLLPAIAGLAQDPETRRRCFYYTALSAVMMVVFSAIFRWQPWHTRLLIPAVAIAALPVGMVLARSGRGIVRLCVLAALLAGWWPSLSLRARPLIGRGSVVLQPESKLLFANLPEDGYVIESLSRVMAKLRPETLLIDTADASVYPVLRSLDIAAGREVELHGPGESRRGTLDAVLRYRRQGDTLAGADALDLGDGEQLVLARRQDRWSLWLRPELVAQVAAPAFFPAFYGFESPFGLGLPQGPYAEFGLPVFRNALGDRVIVTVPGSPQRRVLYLELLPYIGRQTVRLQIAGRAPVDLALGAPDQPKAELVLPLGVASDSFRIELLFAPRSPTGSDPDDRVALRVSRLQILPEAP